MTDPDRISASDKATGLRRFRRMLRDESGATAIEYGLIASVVVIVIIAGVTGYGEAITAQWNWISGVILANVRSS